MTSATATSLQTWTVLFDEMGDLKRIRVAHADGSVAARSFARAWAALAGGADPARVALGECAAAVAAVRLSGVDAGVLSASGVDDDDVAAVLGPAVTEATAALPPSVTDALVEASRHPVAASASPPVFVDALARQPRAGATGVGRRRRLVEPPESHAEHCWAVAVYGTLLALDEGLPDAEVGRTFLLGLAHHLHNAAMPDAGFAGEVLLGDHLDGVVARLADAELATLPPALAERVRRLLEARADADTPLGAAFHAADVLDRVLQVHHHARAAAFTARAALVDLELVHDSPVAAYQHAVVTAAGLDP